MNPGFNFCIEALNDKYCVIFTQKIFSLFLNVYFRELKTFLKETFQKLFN